MLGQRSPSGLCLRAEDDAIVGEFIAELTELERRVFVLVADGRSWRAIATALGLPEPEARTLTRTCERKRTRFLTLYSTGRLCGYRSQTIGSLLSGQERGELAVDQAIAHLRHCHACQVHHKTDAPSLRAAFDARVLSVLPLPCLYTDSHASLLDHLQAAASRVARFFQRVSAPQAGVRERALEVAAGTSAGVKLAAGLASVLLLAGGAVDAATGSHRTGHHGRRHPVALRSHVLLPRTPVPRQPTPRRASTHRLPRPSEQHMPGGFSYLGASSPPRSRPAAVPAVTQHGGGPFGP
jgi:hypothetical protein